MFLEFFLNPKLKSIIYISMQTLFCGNPNCGQVHQFALIILEKVILELDWSLPVANLIYWT